MKYELRTVVFIDILGFKNMLREGREALEIAEILESMRLWTIQNNKNGNDVYKEYKESMEIAYFSDSIVISCLKEKDHFIIDDTARLQIELMRKGIFIRGGITEGLLYHKDNIIFGKALVDAYETESKISRYPRIVLDKNYRYEGSYYSKDFDGYYFINPFRMLRYMRDNENVDMNEYINNIYLNVNTNIEKYKEFPEILSKYAWLKQFMDEVFYLQDGEFEYFEILNSTYDRSKMFQLLRDYLNNERNKRRQEEKSEYKQLST